MTRRSLLVLALLAADGRAAVARPKAADQPPQKTRHEGKPPGWRPDQPSESGGDVVARMARECQGYGILPHDRRADPGPFFDEYHASMKAMQDGAEQLRAVSLLPEGTNTKSIDGEMRKALEANIKSLEWQHRQMEYLEGFESSQSSSDVSAWTAKARKTYLVMAGVVSNSEVSKLSEDRQLALAQDLAKLHRVFKWSFNNMPDDEEAHEITMQKNNKEEGYPPPSPPPAKPNGPADEL